VGWDIAGEASHGRVNARQDESPFYLQVRGVQLFAWLYQIQPATPLIFTRQMG
jgi:hypothetical protein